jgi:hypothetical protein
MEEKNGGIGGIIICGLVALGLIGSCTQDSGSTSSTTSTYTSSPSSHSDYHDMRSRGHSEEDAVIFQMLKNQGYSDYDAIDATMSSKNR